MTHSVYLIRHCQAAGQEADAPLTELGDEQAIKVAERLSPLPIGGIVSSPFRRAVKSIEPLSVRLGLGIETDERMAERVLSSRPFGDWKERLALTFEDLDLTFEGGESSRAAMDRGVSALHNAVVRVEAPVVLVTHGNLMALILKHFNPKVGFKEWEMLRNPHAYRIEFSNDGWSTLNDLG